MASMNAPVGKIVGVQGLQGELRVNPPVISPNALPHQGPGGCAAARGEPTEIKLKKGRQLPGKSLFVVRFEGIDNRNTAETLVGQELLVSADDRPELREGEFHLLDLMGLGRLTADGPAVGTVSDLIGGGNDLLEITTAEGRKLLIRGGDRAEAVGERLAAAHPPPGLLEL